MLLIFIYYFKSIWYAGFNHFFSAGIVSILITILNTDILYESGRFGLLLINGSILFFSWRISSSLKSDSFKGSRVFFAVNLVLAYFYPIVKPINSWIALILDEKINRHKNNTNACITVIYLLSIYSFAPEILPYYIYEGSFITEFDYFNLKLLVFLTVIPHVIWTIWLNYLNSVLSKEYSEQIASS